MRIEMNGKAFKNYMERAAAIAKPGAVLACWESIEIVANDDGVFLKAMDGNSAVTIRMDAFMVETGSAFVYSGDMKRICNLTGYITIESKNERLSVQNGIKKSDVRALSFDDVNPFYEDMECKGELFHIRAGDLLNAFSITDPAREVIDNSVRQAMTGYNIHGFSGKIIGCDGFRMHAVKLATYNENHENFNKYNRIIYGTAYAQLKKILKGCTGTEIIAYDYSGYMKLVGVDFEYYIKYIEDTYPDVYGQVYLPAYSKREYSYMIDADELRLVAKDYAQQRASQNEHIMYLMSNGSDMISAFSSCDYRTADKLTSAKEMDRVREDHIIGLNPTYVSAAMNAISNCNCCGDIEIFGEYKTVDGSNIKPLGIRHGDIDMIILPVRGNIERIRNIRDFICAM